jgi:hypothetical protein
MAQSMTWHAMVGATTLIIAISFLATLLPAHVHQPGGLEREQACHVDLAAGLGNALLRHGLGATVLPKATRRRRTFAHQLQCAFGQANQAHAMVNAARAKATLGNLEATTFAEQNVADRHTHVLKQHSPCGHGARRRSQIR